MVFAVSARQPWRTQRGCARTEKSCGPDARGSGVKSCGDVRPTGTRIDQLQGDGGNSATLPGESTKDTVKTIAQGRPGDRHTCGPTPCAFFARGTSGASWRPAFPAPLLSKGARPKQSSGEMSREAAKACLGMRRGSFRRRHLPTLRCEEPLRRSNPESNRRGILDCFAALAMTESNSSSRSYRACSTASCEREAAARFMRSKLQRATANACDAARRTSTIQRLLRFRALPHWMRFCRKPCVKSDSMIGSLLCIQAN